MAFQGGTTRVRHDREVESEACELKLVNFSGLMRISSCAIDYSIGIITFESYAVSRVGREE